jgi:hypothetical protein
MYQTMKKRAIALVISALFALPYSAGAAAEKPAAVFEIGNGKYTVNGMAKNDIAPYIKNGRTYLPLRYVGYALGIGDNSVLWQSSKQTAHLAKLQRLVSVKAGEKKLTVNGHTIPIDAAAELREGRMMLPLRALAEAFDCRVEWKPDTKQVIIYTDMP